MKNSKNSTYIHTFYLPHHFTCYIYTVLFCRVILYLLMASELNHNYIIYGNTYLLPTAAFSQLQQRNGLSNVDRVLPMYIKRQFRL